MIELLIVIAIIALGATLMSWALPDGDAARLDEEGERLTALLEIARSESRISGATVRWIPGAGATPDAVDAQGRRLQFSFAGLAQQRLPTHWLDDRTSAEVVGATSVLLGPEAIQPPQRIVLRLGGRRLELASDGLGPFAVVTAPADATQAAATP